MIRVIPIFAVGVMLAACQPATLNSYCSLSKAISWSKKDTRQTRREVIAHNATYDSQKCPAIKSDIESANKEIKKSRRRK